MAHYAFLDETNKVTEVIVGIDETELIDGLTPENWYSNYRGQKCVRTSYNGKIRFNYAGIGHTYNETLDAFISAQCHAEAVLNNKCQWECDNHEHQAKTF